MLTTLQVQAHLARLTYKPGWALRAYEGRWEGQHIVIRVTLPDSTQLGGETVLDVHSMLPPMRDTDALEDWVAWRLARLEVHEMREFLKRDDVVIYDPHAPGAEHDVR
jgi:hypothetical protein